MGTDIDRRIVQVVVKYIGAYECGNSCCPLTDKVNPANSVLPEGLLK